MKASIKIAIAAAALTLVSGAAFAQSDDGFAPPQAAPAQKIASAEIAPPGSSAVPNRAWSPDTDAPQTHYSTQNSLANNPVEQQAAAHQPAPQQVAPQTRYASQGPTQSSADNFQPVPPQQPVVQQQQSAPPPLRYATQTRAPDTTPMRSDSELGYRLGSGDKVRVIVYGEDDLGGEFDVDSTGFVRLPLIGQVQAAGLTVRDFEQMVTQRLADGYLQAPKVSAEVTTYRPFYIIGEVGKPGEYPYVNGMNVVTAVALAGGFSYRADSSDVYVRRNGSRKEEELPANERTIIYPGDIIRIAERFF